MWAVGFTSCSGVFTTKNTNGHEALRMKIYHEGPKGHEEARSLAADCSAMRDWGAAASQPRARGCYTVLSAKSREEPLRAAKPCGGSFTTKNTNGHEALRMNMTAMTIVQYLG